MNRLKSNCSANSSVNTLLVVHCLSLLFRNGHARAPNPCSQSMHETTESSEYAISEITNPQSYCGDLLPVARCFMSTILYYFSIVYNRVSHLVRFLSILSPLKHLNSRNPQLGNNYPSGLPRITRPLAIRTLTTEACPNSERKILHYLLDGRIHGHHRQAQPRQPQNTITEIHHPLVFKPSPQPPPPAILPHHGSVHGIPPVTR